MTDYTYLSKMNDEELWRLTVSGDARAEEELIERYTRLVRICARPYFLAGGDSEDLTQEDIKAKFEHGTLKLMVPNKENRPKVEETKHITIEG